MNTTPLPTHDGQPVQANADLFAEPDELEAIRSHCN